MGCQCHHASAARPLEITARMRKRERVQTRAELGAAAPVAAQHEGMVFRKIVVDAHERGRIVIEPLVGGERRRERKPETPLRDSEIC